MTNLIDEYVKILDKYTDIPKVFKKAGGYFIVSTLLGQAFEIPTSHVRRPNVWFLPSSIPGRMRRSTLLATVKNVLRTAYMEHYTRTNPQKTSTEDDINLYRNSLISDGSYEGVFDKVSEGVRKGITTYSIMSSEWGNTLKQLDGGKNYRQGVDSFFSSLYYGEEILQDLSTRTGNPPRYVPPGVYVTMFSCIQEPNLYLSEYLVRQGLLRRIMIGYIKAKTLKMDEWKEPIDSDVINLSEDLQEFTKNQIVPLMIKYKIGSPNLIRVDLTTDVRKSINTVAKKVDKDIILDDSNYNIFVQTNWEHLTKLTVLEAISSGTIFKSETDDYSYNMGLANDVHFGESKKFFDELTRYYREMMDDLNVRRVLREVDTGLDYVLRKIIQKEFDGASRTYLLNSIAGMTKFKLDGYIGTLIEARKIAPREIKTKGRPRVKYIAIEYLTKKQPTS